MEEINIFKGQATLCTSWNPSVSFELSNTASMWQESGLFVMKFGFSDSRRS